MIQKKAINQKFKRDFQRAADHPSDDHIFQSNLLWLISPNLTFTTTLPPHHSRLKAGEQMHEVNEKSDMLGGGGSPQLVP